MSTLIKLRAKLRELDCSAEILMFLIFILGAFVRLVHVVNAGFPLNDGGLFYAMIEDLQRNHYVLPFYTSYNALDIPYTYPPLPFYLTGTLQEIFRFALIEVVTYLPPILSSLTIPVFYLLVKQIFMGKTVALFATLTYTFLPRSFLWLIMGGGVTRAIATIFALLTIYLAILFFKYRNWLHLFFAALFAGFTLLSHPEAALFVAISVSVVFYFYRKDWSDIKFLACIGALTSLIIAPWVITILTHHGSGPLVSAFSSMSTSFWDRLFIPILTLFRFNFAEETGLTVLSVIGLLGLIRLLQERNFFIPIWLLAVMMVYSRGTPTYSVLPLAMLAGYGFVNVVFRGFSIEYERDTSNPQALFESKFARIFFGIVLISSLASAYIYPFNQEGENTLVSLTRGEIEAMSWIHEEIDESAKFLVITGRSWWTDPTSEWFPVLAQRVSLATVQGNEWLQEDQFHYQWLKHDRLELCIQQGIDCVYRWSEEYALDFDYIFFTKSPNTTLLIHSFINEDHFKLAYENNNVAIFRVQGTHE